MLRCASTLFLEHFDILDHRLFLKLEIMDSPDNTSKDMRRLQFLAETPHRTFDLDNSNMSLTPNRTVGSLVLLTQKFVELMKSNQGEIDLKDVSISNTV